MESINLENITLSNAVRLMMENSEYDTFKKIAETIEVPKSTFQSSLNNNAMRIRDLIKVAELLGYTLTLEKKQI